MNLQYELRHGSFYLFDLDAKPHPITKEREIRLMTDTVAICFDRSTGMLLKHGRPENVGPWAAASAKKYREAGMTDIANDIVVVSGAFPVEEINKCLSISGYGNRFMEKMATMLPTKAEPVSMPSCRREPGLF